MTDPDPTAERARAAADRLLSSSRIMDESARRGGRAGDPLAVHDPAGRVAGWVVPVIVDGALSGFVQLDYALELVRYSRFPDRAAAERWFDGRAAVRVAARQFPECRIEEEPFVSYDRDVTRLVWAIRTTSGDRIFVAGDYAYREPRKRDVTG